jgi:hypothetical protein
MTFPFPNLSAFTDRLLEVTTPIVIAFLPILLHLIDKGMERFSPIRHEVLRGLMRDDPRQIVKSVGETEPNFDAVKTYFGFERNCHFVIALAVFNIISLYIAQAECTKSLLCATPITLPLIIIFVIFLMIFLLGLANRRFSAAAVNATRRWERIAVGAFILVIAVEIALHFTCPEPNSINPH